MKYLGPTKINTSKTNGREIYLIVVGKLKDAHLESLERNYLKRIFCFKLTIIELKSHQDNREVESLEILKKISELSAGKSAHLLLLTESGKLQDSEKFSKAFFHLVEEKSGVKKIFLVVGGAHGFSQKLLDAADEQISLSPLTFPHKLARLILIEQIYRAQTIHYGHPYHH